MFDLVLGLFLSLSSPAYLPEQLMVSNWRWQAAQSLDLADAHIEALAIGQTDAFKPRCIKMNNYWCIKHSNWNGEIAFDAEGHVAFASAQEGALAAAVLLRRYYVDFHLHSAKDILSRWAPPDCGLGQISASNARALAPRGLRNTLRARYIASKRGGKHKLATSRVKSIIVPTMRAPVIMEGGGETSKPTRLASLDVTGLTLILPKLSGASCPSEEARLAAYIKAASATLTEKPDDDLGLFDAEGQPTGHLATLMGNMSAVEIGPYRPHHALIDSAVDRLREVLAKAR